MPPATSLSGWPCYGPASFVVLLYDCLAAVRCFVVLLYEGRPQGWPLQSAPPGQPPTKAVAPTVRRWLWWLLLGLPPPPTLLLQGGPDQGGPASSARPCHSQGPSRFAPASQGCPPPGPRHGCLPGLFLELPPPKLPRQGCPPGHSQCTPRGAHRVAPARVVPAGLQVAPARVAPARVAPARLCPPGLPSCRQEICAC